MYSVKKYLFFFLLITDVICFSQDRKVELEINGTKIYNDLYLYSMQFNKPPIEFEGKTTNGSKWTFSIPDSIAKKTKFFNFRGNKPVEDRIVFFCTIQGDTLKGREIHFDKDEMLIRLKVDYHHTVHEVNSQYFPSLKKLITIQEWDADYFFIDLDQNQHLKENMLDPTFGFTLNGEKYSDFFADIASKIKENPNSNYYMSRLAATANNYSSKNDLAQLYYLFSNEMQNSFFGQIVYNTFSTFRITNVSLVNYNTKIEERIVEDFDKYTLLAFSASWCAPCHEKIPLLKKIHEEKSNVLNIAYISTDDEKTLSQWEKLMIKEKIPWRSLVLNKELKELWNIGAIPDYILINPNWEARKIKLNDENDINSLYSIIQNK